MMAVRARHSLYTLEEYLRLEEHANVRHEFLDGAIYALAGGTPEHGAIAMRLAAALVSQLRGKGCTVYSSDVRVRVEATGLVTYPDLSVVCGERRVDSADRDALVDPVILVEVLSPSTESYDRGEKLDHYRLIPTLREIVLVSHERPRVELWRRGEEGWESEVLESGEICELRSLGCRLEIDALYRD